MPRRKTKKPSQNWVNAHEHKANHCRALVKVDGTDARKKVKKDYEKALRDLENSRSTLDQFHKTDKPQFVQWLNSNFGAFLTELRELHLKMEADEAIVFMVENEVMFHGGSYAKAYKRVTQPEEVTEPTPPPNSGQAGNTGPFDPDSDFSDFDDEDEDPMAEFFKAMHEKLGMGDEPWNKPQHGTGQPSEGSTALPAAQRLKELYRAVVRRLHPDKQQEMTAQKTEWWHQAQTAYESGDAEQLEVILTLCDIGESGTTAHTSASLLHRITAQLRNSLREIKRQINEFRRDPAWNFSKRNDHAQMAVQISREMTTELAMMRRRCEENQQLIAKWKAAAEKTKPSRRRQKAQMGTMEFGF